MQSIKTPDKKISIWLYCFVYYLIIGSDCILFCFNKNQRLVDLAQYFMAFVAVIVGVLALANTKGKHMKKKYLFLFFTIVSLVITAIYHGEFSGGYISIIALFVLGTSFFDVVDPAKFKKAFLDIMTVICIVSLVTFIFSTFCLKLPLFPSVYNTLGKEYRFFFFSNVAVADTARNYGLFTEPSRFQAYLNLSLLFLMFEQEKKISAKRILLFVVTLITTFSTTGYIAFFVIMIAFVLSPKARMKAIYKTLLIVFMSVVVSVLFLNNEEFAWAITKITAGEASKSASTRFNALFANVINFFDYFPFGTGIQGADPAFQSALSNLGNAHSETNTTTFLIYFSKFGVVPGLYYAISMIRSVRNMSNKGSTILSTVAFFAMTCGISMINSILFSIVVFYPPTFVQKDTEEKFDKSLHKSYYNSKKRLR